MKILINIFCLIFLLVSQIQSQQFTIGSPEWLIEMFFDQNQFDDKARYFTGEMLNYSEDKTIGEELNGEAEVSFHQIRASNNAVVFAVEVQTENTIRDFYTFLVKDNDQWKITSIRTFLLPAFIYTVRDSLSNITELSKQDSVFLLSLKLFTSSDKELKNYLASNINKFQELISAFVNNEKDKADVMLASAGCSAIYMDNNYPGCTFVQILNFEEMEVGFINVSDSSLLPTITIQEFVYLEEVVKGWFIYRIM